MLRITRLGHSDGATITEMVAGHYVFELLKIDGARHVAELTHTLYQVGNREVLRSRRMNSSRRAADTQTRDRPR
jgi:hypothetical protein